VSEYKALQKAKSIESSSRLSTFLDEHRVIRLGGRLRNSNLAFEARRLVILPKDHPIKSAIITDFHQKHHHAEPVTACACSVAVLADWRTQNCNACFSKMHNLL